jgi:vacuolar protein sorting-associated protein 41
MHWQDDSTLLIAWANYIKVARVRSRPRTTSSPSSANLPPMIVEITAVFQLECMIAGIVPHPSGPELTSLTSFLILAYTPSDTSFLREATEDRAEQARKAAERPELRIISRAGEELTADAISISGFQSWSCNDYCLVEVESENSGGRCYVVLSPQDLVIVRPRDKKDHIAWLVDQKRYEEALDEVEKLGEDTGEGINMVDIGQKYVEHLINERESRHSS